MCTIYKKLELAQIIQHSVKVLLPTYFNENNAFSSSFI